jgi:nucleoside-diphosphate-sugar epimerase
LGIHVTGHHGYIGSVPVPMLEHARHHVVGLDSNVFAGCTFGPSAREPESLETDVRDVESNDLVGVDAVIVSQRCVLIPSASQSASNPRPPSRPPPGPPSSAASRGYPRPCAM